MFQLNVVLCSQTKLQLSQYELYIRKRLSKLTKMHHDKNWNQIAVLYVDSPLIALKKKPIDCIKKIFSQQHISFEMSANKRNYFFGIGKFYPTRDYFTCIYTYMYICI